MRTFGFILLAMAGLLLIAASLAHIFSGMKPYVGRVSGTDYDEQFQRTFEEDARERNAELREKGKVCFVVAFVPLILGAIILLSSPRRRSLTASKFRPVSSPTIEIASESSFDKRPIKGTVFSEAERMWSALADDSEIDDYSLTRVLPYLSESTQFILQTYSVQTIGELRQLSREQILDCERGDETVLAELTGVLAYKGLALRESCHKLPLSPQRAEGKVF